MREQQKGDIVVWYTAQKRPKGEPRKHPEAFTVYTRSPCVLLCTYLGPESGGLPAGYPHLVRGQAGQAMTEEQAIHFALPDAWLRRGPQAAVPTSGKGAPS